MHDTKGKNEFFFANSLNFHEVQMGHLHTCLLHLKLMPTTSLLYILHNEETRDNTFGYIFDKLKWDDNTEEIVKNSGCISCES